MALECGSGTGKREVLAETSFSTEAAGPEAAEAIRGFVQEHLSLVESVLSTD